VPYRGLVAVVVLAAVVSAFSSSAGAAPACRFRLGVAALAGPGPRTELSLAVSPVSVGCLPPTTLRSARVDLLVGRGSARRLLSLPALQSPGGRASLRLPALARRRRLRVTVRVAPGSPLAATTVVRLRPNLVLDDVSAPSQVLAGTRFTLSARVAEVNGDLPAMARLTVTDGATVVGAVPPVRLPPRGVATVQASVVLADGGAHDLQVAVTETSGRETDTRRNRGDAAVQTLDFRVDAARVVVPSFAGYGAQLNQNVYAELSRQAGVTDENVGDMEQKLVALGPQLVRIFFNRAAYSAPDQMQSFLRTVDLAQRAGATINVTWGGGGELDPQGSMSRFADVLVDLVRNRGITRLRWVTLENEPNSNRVTMDQYEALYRALDADLRNAGIRNQIRFMGGDLVAATSPLGQSQADWFGFMASRLGDLLDAWSIHVFWDYWDTPKLVRRLTEVRQIVDALPAEQRRPLYVTEFSTRGIRNLDGVAYPQPGVFADGTPLARTNVNAFQQAWFAVLAPRLGYYGAVKWDGYFGKYDRGTQDFSLIGPPQEGWPLRPVYNVLRLLTSTVAAGSRVVATDGDASTRLLTAFASPGGALTLVGLDTAGGQLNAPSGTTTTYSIGGLSPGAAFQLMYWNVDGSGQLAPGPSVRADASGTLTVAAPLQSVFAAVAVPA
jgi:hypothetical protein